MDDLSKLPRGSDRLGSEALDAPAAPGGPELASAIQAQGGLDALIAKLRDAGLGDAVDSWVGTGPNQAIAPKQLGDALGGDGTKRLGGSSGIDFAALLPMLAAFLPQIVNMLTPKGTVPDGGLDGAAAGGAAGGIPDLGDLIGGVLGGGAATSRSGARKPADAGGLDDVLGGLGGLLGGDKGR